MDLEDLDPEFRRAMQEGIARAMPPELLNPQPIHFPEPPHMAEFRRLAAEKAEDRQRQIDAEAREVKLAELAFAAEESERRRERRERWLFWITVASLIFAIIAAVTGTIAIT